jgi:hypothetical protein
MAGQRVMAGYDPAFRGKLILALAGVVLAGCAPMPPPPAPEPLASLPNQRCRHPEVLAALRGDSLSVMAGLRPGHPRLSCFSAFKTWMPGTRPGMTNQMARPNFIGRFFDKTLRMTGACIARISEQALQASWMRVDRGRWPFAVRDLGNRSRLAGHHLKSLSQISEHQAAVAA